MANHDIMISKK